MPTPSTKRRLLERGDPVNAAALPFHGKGCVDEGVLQKVSEAFDLIEASDAPDKPALRDRAAAAAAEDLARVARACLAQDGGEDALKLHPVFGPDPSKRLHDLEEHVARKIAKETHRRRGAAARRRFLRKPFRTAEASDVFRRHPRAASTFAARGYVVLDDALPSDVVAALRRRCDAEISRGAWGPPNSDPCNRGSVSRTIIARCDGDAPAHAALRLLAGCAYEFEQRLPGLRLAVPPEAAVASYAAGVRYFRRADIPKTGRDVDIPRRRIAATPRPRRGRSVETGARAAGISPTWTGSTTRAGTTARSRAFYISSRRTGSRAARSR